MSSFLKMERKRKADDETMKDKKKRRDKELKEQINNIRAEAGNSEAITSDVLETGLEAYPGHVEESLDNKDTLDDFEETIVQNFVEGKTWNTDRE
jgi:hypothetical protein